jgi:hypothetical protein
MKLEGKTKGKQRSIGIRRAGEGGTCFAGEEKLKSSAVDEL